MHMVASGGSGILGLASLWCIKPALVRCEVRVLREGPETSLGMSPPHVPRQHNLLACLHSLSLSPEPSPSLQREHSRPCRTLERTCHLGPLQPCRQENLRTAASAPGHLQFQITTLAS